MRSYRWATIFAAGAIVTGAFGQKSARLDSIWAAASERITTQQDAWFVDGEFPATIQLLKFAAELEPANYEVWTNLGWMLENVEEYAPAQATYERYRRQNPQEPDNGLPLADFYFRRREYAKIPPILEPALPRKVHPNTFRILALAYERMGKLTDARRVLRTFIARAPQDPRAKLNLARVEKKIADAKPPR